MVTDFLEGLNEPQKEAVLHTEGPLLIFAGAGSGKTRVITQRIAHIIQDIGSSAICAVTFTNKAAAEMRERVEGLVSHLPYGVQIKTFHSLALWILRREHKAIGYPSSFTVYDSSLQESLLKEVIKDLGMDVKQMRPSQIGSSLGMLKDSLITPDNFYHFREKGPYNESLYSIFVEYEKRKFKNQALDFGDLLFKTVELFQSHEEIRQKYSGFWNYVMVDEYQDTNRVQYEFIRLLSKDHRNICVVGDDDQSIYSWRGADISNILDFEKDFPDAKVVKLEENYRSTGHIIEAASHVIRNNTRRQDKSLYTLNQSGETISLSEFENETEEAHSVIAEIKKAKNKGSNYSDIAVFYRTNAQSRYFEEALRQNSIPYKIFGGFRFFDRAEIKDVIAYLNVVNNPLDSLSLLRIVNVPLRGIGGTSQEKIRQFSIAEGISFLEALENDRLPLKRAALQKARSLAHSFSEWIQMNEDGIPPSQIALRIVESTGLLESYENENTDESVARAENLREFINSMEEYESNSDEPSLAEYLNQISLITSEDNNRELSDYVNLMTVHNAKGLEFGTVFLAGLEEGTFPHIMSLEDPAGEEEERRLLYVAITRAKKKLYLSHCRFSRKFGKVEPRIPSRFLEELPEYVLEKGPGQFRMRMPSGPPSSGNAKGFAPESNRSVAIDASDPAEFQTGDLVLHKTYGKGRIVSISGKGENRKVKIEFGNLEKNFLLAYTPLQKVS